MQSLSQCVGTEYFTLFVLVACMLKAFRRFVPGALLFFNPLLLIEIYTSINNKYPSGIQTHDSYNLS